MLLGVLPNEDDVDGVEPSGDKGQHVATIEVTQTFFGHREKVQTDEGGKRTAVGRRATQRFCLPWNPCSL